MGIRQALPHILRRRVIVNHRKDKGSDNEKEKDQKKSFHRELTFRTNTARRLTAC